MNTPLLGRFSSIFDADYINEILSLTLVEVPGFLRSSRISGIAVALKDRFLSSARQTHISLASSSKFGVIYFACLSLSDSMLV